MEIRLHSWNFNVGFQPELFLNSASKSGSCSGKEYICTILKEEKKNCFSLDCCCSVAKSCLTLVSTWTVTSQAPLSMRFFRQEYWSGLPFPSPGNLPNPEDKTYIFCIGRHILYHCTTREDLFIRKDIKICEIKILGSINDIYFS